MAKHRKRIRLTRFGLLLGLWLLLVTAAGVVGLTWLWNTLSDYQVNYEQEQALKQQADEERAAQKAVAEAAAAEEAAAKKALSRAPQLAFQEWYENRSPADWAGEWLEKNAHPYENLEAAETSLEALFDPAAVECLKADDFTAEVPVYVIKNNGRTLSRVTLSGSGLDWKVADYTIEVLRDNTGTITVPAGTTVYCNCNVIDEVFAVDEGVYFPDAQLEKLLKEPLSWTTWSVTGLYLTPEQTTDLSAEYRIEAAEDGTFMLYLTETDEKIAEKAEAFTEEYIYYFMRGESSPWTNMTTVRERTPAGSPGYSKLTKSYDGVSWATSYSNIATDITIGDRALWAENCISVDVAYHAEGDRLIEAHDGSTEIVRFDYADATMRIYFLKTGNGWEIYDFEVL